MYSFNVFILIFLIYYAKTYTVPPVTFTERMLQTNGSPGNKCAILIVGNVEPPNVAGCNVIVPVGVVPYAGSIPHAFANDEDWPDVSANTVVALKYDILFKFFF
jgi:hypothetical protein